LKILSETVENLSETVENLNDDGENLSEAGEKKKKTVKIIIYLSVEISEFKNLEKLLEKLKNTRELEIFSEIFLWQKKKKK